MDIDPKNYYRMPLIMGPLWVGETPFFNYPQTEIVAMQYLTNPDAILALLPGS